MTEITQKTTPVDLAIIVKKNILFILKCITEILLYALVPYFALGSIIVILYFIFGLTLEQIVLSIIMVSLISCLSSISYLLKKVG